MSKLLLGLLVAVSVFSAEAEVCTSPTPTIENTKPACAYAGKDCKFSNLQLMNFINFELTVVGNPMRLHYYSEFNKDLDSAQACQIYLKMKAVGQNIKNNF